jgi:hypothetical protein
VVLCPQKAYRCVRLNVSVKLSASIQRFTQRARCKAGVKGQGGILKKSYSEVVQFLQLRCICADKFRRAEPDPQIELPSKILLCQHWFLGQKPAWSGDAKLG